MIVQILKQALKLYLCYALFLFTKLVFYFGKSRLFNRHALASIKSKFIVITGATDGIGKALALNLAKRKYDLILIGRNPDKLQDMHNEVSKHGVKCITLQKDFTQDLEFPELKDFTIGLLINNVGMCSDGPRLFIDDIRVHDIITCNIQNTFKLTQLVLIKMKQARSGYIINVGSVTGDLPMPMLATYSASKAMLKAWTESLYTECLEWNVNVELMNTGYVATKMSGIRNESVLCPSAERYAKCVVEHFGKNSESWAFFPHLVMYWLLCLVPRHVIAYGCMDMQRAVRKKMDNKSRKKKNK